MEGIIESAQAGFASTTGFAMSDVVTWAGDNLIKVFIGSGLGILYELRWWIVALIVISIGVYFSYRAFRFMRA